MAHHVAPRWSLDAVRIATGTDDESGVLVGVDGRIVAVLVKLEAACHELAIGLWYLEIGFGPCAGTPAPFNRLSDGLLWIAKRLGQDETEMTDVLARADRYSTAPAEAATTVP